MLKCNTVSGIYGENLLLSCLGKLIHELVGKGYIFTNLYIENYTDNKYGSSENILLNLPVKIDHKLIL